MRGALDGSIIPGGVGHPSLSDPPCPAKSCGSLSTYLPRWGRLTALILPTANTEMMSLFLTHVAQEFSDFFIVMLVDRAGWHTAQRLIVPENIRLTFQPARSPELNPTEHIWEELREKTLPNPIVFGTTFDATHMSDFNGDQALTKVFLSPEVI